MSLPSVLVVDDDQAIRETLRDILEPEGFDVRLAENGLLALKAIRAAQPEVVILDLMMPVMSGWEFLVQANADETLRHLPIIVLSAMCAPLAPAERTGGVRCCLGKPVDLDVLLNALRSAIEESHTDGASTTPRR